MEDKIKTVIGLDLNIRSKPIQYKVDENGCHTCISHYTRNDGYISVKIKGKNIRVHRLVYELHNGKIDNGLVVMHTCDNPSCINPNHMELGTHKENMEDKSKKNRTPKSQVRLTQDKKLELCLSNLTESDLCKKYGVSYRTVRNVKKRYREGCEKL
jgi:hypothetical protein